MIIDAFSMVSCDYHPDKEAKLECDICQLHICYSDRRTYSHEVTRDEAILVQCCIPCYTYLETQKQIRKPKAFVTRIALLISIMLLLISYFAFLGQIVLGTIEYYPLGIFIMSCVFLVPSAAFAYGYYWMSTTPYRGMWLKEKKDEFLKEVDCIPAIISEINPQIVLKQKYSPKSICYKCRAKLTQEDRCDRCGKYQDDVAQYYASNPGA
ncbi:MAG: hypothetical protein INQ03_10805 [Candidatus Heimdallarchaeota archaeon]|nr:hypothetical protein [Candidatus Heimdallarchaeota archaeon]